MTFLSPISQLAIASILLVVTISWWRIGRRSQLASEGWGQILWGLGLLALGALVGLRDAVPVPIGKPSATLEMGLDFLEQVIGYLCGTLAAAIGLSRWLPAVLSRLRTVRPANIRTESSQIPEIQGLASQEVTPDAAGTEGPWRGSEIASTDVLACAPIILLATDAAGNLSWARGDVPKSLGSSGPGALVGQNIYTLLPDLLTELQQAISGEMVSAVVRAEDQVIRYRLGPRRNAKGEIEGVICVGDDISDLDAKERKLQDAKAAAEAANQAKSYFLASMSHEIRTPLAAILGLSELLLLEEDLPETARDCASRMASSADGLATLIGNVLDFSKIESDMLVLEDVEFGLGEVLAQLKAIVELEAESRGLELQLETAEPAPRLIGDPTRLLQVLVNLTGNAIKFTSEGQVMVRVEQMRTDEGGKLWIRYTVADTGSGISTSQQEKIFEPFVQTDRSVTRKFGGTGLGLAISKRLVEIMGGEVSVQSRLGEGSVFYFDVPFSIPGGAVDCDVPTERVIHSEDVDQGSRVLVAEDDQLNRIVLLELLETLGHRAVGVTNGKEVLNALQDNDFDLVIMDCMMPALDGYGATRALRLREGEDPGNPRIPVIALTANAMAGQRERCLEAGMDDFITKPVRQRELGEVLARWLPSSGPACSEQSEAVLEASTERE